MTRSSSFSLALLAVLAACAAPARAEVRFFHLSPDTPPVDILAGLSPDAKAPIVEGLAYGSGTGYLPVPTGNYFIDVTPANQPDVVAIGLENLPIAGNRSYTAAAIGTLADDGVPLTALLLEDNAVISSQAQLRIVHASADAGAVDIFVNGGLALSSFEFGSATGYIGFDPGLYDIEIIQVSSGDTLASFSQLELFRGQVSTAFAIGLVNPAESFQAFNVLLTSDAVIPEPASVAMVSMGMLALVGAGLRRRFRRAD